MKKAIYMVLMEPGAGWKWAGMESYTMQALAWAESLRRVNFSGDIFLLTNSKELLDSLNKGKNPHRLIVLPLDWEPTSKEPANVFAKLHASEFFPAEDYDRVMGADVDLFALRPVDRLFEFPGELNAAQSLVSHMSDVKHNGGLFTEPEIKRMRNRRGLNSGLFVCDGNHLSSIEAKWRETHLTGEFRPGAVEADQPSFNAMVYREKVDFFPFPRHLVVIHRRKFFPKETLVAHYAGGKKRIKLKQLKRRVARQKEREIASAALEKRSEGE